MLSLAGTPNILSDFIPDNGLAGLAAALVKNGHSVKIVDYNSPELFTDILSLSEKKFLERLAEKIFIKGEKPALTDLFRLKLADAALEKNKERLWHKIADNLSERVEKEKLNFVGMKLWTGEGFAWSVNIGRHLKKKHPGLSIFAGGPQVDIFGQCVLEQAGFVDALCYGEGEETIVRLANFVVNREKLEHIPNLLFKRDGIMVRTERKYVDNLDALPMPIYSPDVYEGIERKIKLLVLDESRGCPNCCSFCIHPVKSGKRREKSALRIVAEMKHYREAYGVKMFRFAGSNTPPGLMKEIAGLIQTEGLKVEYASFGSIKEFTGVADFDLMKKSGCRALFFGVETVNEDILLKGMNRRIDRTVMEQVLSASKKSGIFTVVSIIHPAPFETPQTRAETLEFLKHVRPDAVLVQFPGIYPGTPWFDEPQKYNFSLDKATYPGQVMGYQIKALFPPRYWKPLPYRVNGMSFRRFARETEMFQRDLNAAGINTSISDEAYLMYAHTDFPSPEEFLKMNRFFFYAGKDRELNNEIRLINERSR